MTPTFELAPAGKSSPRHEKVLFLGQERSRQVQDVPAERVADGYSKKQKINTIVADARLAVVN